MLSDNELKTLEGKRYKILLEVARDWLVLMDSYVDKEELAAKGEC